MINVGVIGYGYWGPNLVRNFLEAPGSEVTAVSDTRPARLGAALTRYPSVRAETDFRALINDPAIDALSIATPVSTHFEIAMQALQSDKHVLIEKPLAATSEQALRLIDEADKRNLVLMVDHTFVYTSAVQKIKGMIVGDDLGELYYYDSVRVNLGLFQHDVNVVWDLAVHDLAIIDHSLPARPCAVSATGMSHLSESPENVAYVTLFFDSRMIAHIHVNWLAPVKIRRTLIGGSRKMIVYDDLEPSEKIKVYDKGVTLNNDAESIYQMLVGYRAGDMWAPHLEITEALQTAVRHFIRCIDKNQRPTTDGHAGLRVVQILEAATESMANRGRPLELASSRGTA